jgi:glycosyltransferase involved in cell wall biosynthesis
MARRAVSRRPRVAHFTVAPEFVDRIMLHDLRRLREHEEITVLCTAGPVLERVREEGFRVVVVPARRKMSPVADLKTIWALWRLFRRERFDLLHTYTPKAGLLGQIAGALAGVPRRVHGCRGLLYSRTTPWWQDRIFRITDRITSSLAQRTLFLSGADLRYCVSEGLCASDRAVLLGSGIDLRHFQRSAELTAAAAAWRREMGLAPDDQVVLTVGRYVAPKGYEEIARAAAMLRADCPRVRYVWVAPVFAGEDGVLPDDLPRQAGAHDIVRRLGYVDDIRPLLAAADVLLHPSHREGVPRVLLEAAAVGLPIVASDIPGCREIVRHEETALLFPPRDVDAMVQALRRALGDAAATRVRASRAEEEVRTRFDQEALSERVWSVHDSLLRGTDAPGLTSGHASPPPARDERSPGRRRRSHSAEPRS